MVWVIGLNLNGGGRSGKLETRGITSMKEHKIPLR